jgi:tRNA (cmo5U34)-methyltransferase
MERKRPGGRAEITLLTPGQAARPVVAVAAGRDEVFRNEKGSIEDFHFGREVATVFDDMVTRSVPFYVEIQRMIAEMAADFGVADSVVYDLGCATGTTFLHLHPHLHRSVKFVGIDNSAEMLAKCDAKLRESGMDRQYELTCADLDDGVRLEDASVVLLILTLQFVRPLNRDRLIADIYRGLRPHGCLLLVEKVLGEDSLLNRLFISYYYDLKRRNGYSELEITQKREALENVLVPYKLLENRELLLRTGFRDVDAFFKWYNFCGLIAVKS